MTKKEIIAELSKYGIEATLRPRKAILVELLDRVRLEHEKGQLTSPVTCYDDIWFFQEECEKACDPRRAEPNFLKYVICIPLFILSLAVLLPW